MTTLRPIILGLACFFFSIALLTSVGCERKTETTPPPAAVSKLPDKIGILPEGSRRPDVIVILVDALRADRLGAYGNPQMLTPTMDKLAGEGVTFDLAVAQAPWTLPSVATLFTSYYPGVHKALSYQVVEEMDLGKRAVQDVLSEDFTTLAEVMKAGGYQTAGFVAAKFLREGYGFGQGFEHYDTSFADNTVRGELVNQAFLKWFDEQRDPSKPLFTYLHYMDVHGPYNAAARFMDPLLAEVDKKPDKLALEPQQLQRLNGYLRVLPPDATDPALHERLKMYREYWEARYNAGVREADFYLDQLVQNLKQRGVWDNAYVVLIADHGEALCEHDLWEHGYSQYQTDLRVPMILHWPNVLPPGKRVTRLAGLIDLLPTLMEQLRLPGPGNLQGVSLVDHISDRLPEKTPVARFAEGLKGDSTRQYAVFADNTKLIVTHLPKQTRPDGTETKAMAVYQLFNLGTDPLEMFDISKQYPGHVKTMGNLMKKMASDNLELRPAAIAPPRLVDPDTINALASLGYTGGAEEEEDEPASRPALTPASQPASQPTTQPAGANEPKPGGEQP